MRGASAIAADGGERLQVTVVLELRRQCREAAAVAYVKLGRQHILRVLDLDRSIRVVLDTYRDLAANR